MRIEMNIFRKCALVALFSAICGCAGVNSSARSGDIASQGQAGALKDIRISGEGRESLVAITADRPLAYTFYKTENPPKAVIDLAQVEPGAVSLPVEVNKGGVKRIEASKHGEGTAVMTRVEVYLVPGAEVSAATDSRERNILQLSVTAPDVPVPPSVASGASTQPQITASEPAKPEVTASAPVSPAVVEAVKMPATDLTAPASKPAAPAESKETAITAIEAGKDALEIRISGSVSEIKSFRLAKPDRLVVDLAGAKSALHAKVFPVNSLGIGTARIGAYPDKVRIVFDAAGGVLPPLTVEKGDYGVKIAASGRPDEPAKAPVVKAKPSPQPAAPQVAPTQSPKTEKSTVDAEKRPFLRKESPVVEAIDFKVVDGISRLLIDVSGDCKAEKPVRTPEGLSLTLKECILPAKWQRFLDTSAFAGVVQRVTPYQVKTKGGSDVKVQLKLRQASTFELSRTGNVITLDITNPAGLEAPVMAAELVAPSASQKTSAEGSTVITAPKAEGTKKVYTGRRVTLEFSDADIRKIFQLIAEVSNLNFLVGDDVSGTISIKLVNVPWDQALDVILENKGLGMQRDGNIVQIRPKSKIQTLADEEQAMKRAKERAMELKTEVFDINFATVSDISNQFNALKSERGTISQDSRTNRVIVKDIEPNIIEMRSLLKSLDLPEKQVLIEARIVEASSDFTRDIGVQWGIHSTRNLNLNDVGGSAFEANSGFGGILSGTAPASGAFGPGMATGIAFGKIITGGQLDLRLSAAATTGRVKIISTPKVVTLNNKAAKISQGQSIPYQTTSAEGTKTEFVEAALTLEVTPHITADGSVIMKIKASNNSAGAGTPPPINKKEATTELLVKNGETTVIGGIYVDSDTENDQGVPFLKDIPLFGHLFKSSTKTKNKTELLIFITPKVVS